MLALLRKFADHGLARAGGRELALLEWIAIHAHVVGDVQPVLEDAHLGAFDVAEGRDDVGLAVAIGVAQRGEAIATGQVDVAVGGDVEVPAGALAFLHHHRGESVRQREAIVVGGLGADATPASAGSNAILTTRARHAVRMFHSLRR